MRSGFTLVEILIVVIILGILAAIVIPQFTEASNDARESQLKSDLQTVRSQLELYKVQHLDNYPGTVADVALEDQLEGKTNVDGTLNAAGPLGPYLIKFPTNPFASANADGVEVSAVASTNSHGWHFNTASGWFMVGDDDSANAATHRDW